MKKFLFFSILIVLHVTVTAQTPADEIMSRMNHVFEKVNRSNVPTGLLDNYGVQSIPFGYYDGIPADSNFVDIDSYMLLYAGIYSAKFNNNITLITPDELSSRLKKYSSGNSIPVSVMHYEYNRIKEDAVELGLLNVANDQIIEIAGKNPYETMHLFAAGPKEVITEGGTVSFIFPSTLRMTNVSKTVQNLQVRFDEGLAFVNAGWNTVVSYAYTTEGIKKLRFKINYTDGTSFTSQTNIIVRGIPQTGGGTRSTGPGDAAGKAGARYDVVIKSTYAHSGGTMQVKLSSSNTTGKINKALVIAEGFDPYPLLDAANTDLYSLLADPGKTNNIIPEIDNNDYDLVYVDNNNGIDDIKRNAALFMEALDKVNSTAYRNANASPNVVMGISMGGLVARYALRKMEMQSKDHKTWKYISIDSPHKGANVPVGLQAAVRHLSSLDFKLFFISIFKLSDIPMVNNALQVLNSTAAKQMLIYNVNNTGKGYDNSVHNAFLAEYEQMGFPQKCQNVAISNGNSSGTQLFPPGSPLVDINYRYTLTFIQEFLNILLSSNAFTSSVIYGVISVSNYPKLYLNIIPGKTQLGAYININAINSAANSQVYNGAIKFHKKILWLINSSVTLTSSNLKTQSGMLPIDGIAGGLIDIESYMDELPSSFQKFIKQTQFCFIPRGSALALSDWDTNRTANLQRKDLFALNKTDFEYTAMPITDPESHVTFDAVKQYVINQLKDKPVYPDAFQPIFCGTQTVKVKNPLNRPLTWKVSDNSFSITSTTNTSAVIGSTIAKSAILTVASGNTYPLKKRLLSTCNLSVSGPSTVCDQATFTINNLPPGATVQWSASNSNLTFLSGQSSASGVFKKNGNGLCDIKATILAGGQSHPAKPLEVWCGKPIIRQITGKQHFPQGGTGTFRAILENKGNVIYHWSVNPSVPITSSGSYAYITFPSINKDYHITLTVTNSCGSTESNYFVATGENEPFSIYPNPASDMVTVQLPDEPLKSAMSLNWETEGVINKPANSGVYEIQLWSASSMVRRFTTDQPMYQISVSGLPAGIYFVRVIKDGETHTKKLIKR